MADNKSTNEVSAEEALDLFEDELQTRPPICAFYYALRHLSARVDRAGLTKYERNRMLNILDGYAKVNPDLSAAAETGGLTATYRSAVKQVTPMEAALSAGAYPVVEELIRRGVRIDPMSVGIHPLAPVVAPTLKLGSRIDLARLCLEHGGENVKDLSARPSAAYVCPNVASLIARAHPDAGFEATEKTRDEWEAFVRAIEDGGADISTIAVELRKAPWATGRTERFAADILREQAAAEVVEELKVSTRKAPRPAL